MSTKLENYIPKLKVKETQQAVDCIKKTFESILCQKFDFTRVNAPLFVTKNSRLNDSLTGYETPVIFKPKYNEEYLEIVHSLAKWKRMALGKYKYDLHTGIYADMHAIRKDEKTDYYHSIYVDQWDWEYVINEQDYNIIFLYKFIKRFYSVIKDLHDYINSIYTGLNDKLPNDIFCITSTDLYEMYPDLTARERENEICRKYKAVFISQIGDTINNKNDIHDRRAPDYDNWKLNGDILVYNPIHDDAIELMSMGIRVNREALIRQLNNRVENNEYYSSIIYNKIPLTIGGGIGQSRLCMFLLEKMHIGEVQASIWTDDEAKKLAEYIL